MSDRMECDEQWLQVSFRVPATLEEIDVLEHFSRFQHKQISPFVRWFQRFCVAQRECVVQGERSSVSLVFEDLHWEREIRSMWNCVIAHRRHDGTSTDRADRARLWSKQWLRLMVVEKKFPLNVRWSMSIVREENRDEVDKHPFCPELKVFSFWFCPQTLTTVSHAVHYIIIDRSAEVASAHHRSFVLFCKTFSKSIDIHW